MYRYVEKELTIEEKRRFAVISIVDCGRFEDAKYHLLSQYYVRTQLLFIFPTKTDRKREIEKRRIMKFDENKDNFESYWERKTRKMPQPMRAKLSEKVELIKRNSEGLI